MGQVRLADAGRFLEQQSEELSLRQPQQEQRKQPQQQHRFSGCLFSLLHSSASELIEGIRSGVPREESRLAPVIGAALSANQTGPDGLVGSPKTRPAHPNSYFTRYQAGAW